MIRSLSALLLLVSCAAPPAPPEPVLDRGLVVSPEPHASEVGAQVLRDGGNAVDAAIAVQFALAVTFPNAGNVGGGGFMVIHTTEGETAVDYREMAPAAAHRDMYLDDKGNVIPGKSLHTHLASGVPGSVAGMWLAHRKFGSRPWKSLVEPAVRLAANGWILDPWSARSFARQTRNNTQDYFNRKAGERFVQKELAATLQRIADRGRDGFYAGETARLIVEEMQRGGGLISLEDLKGYEAKIRRPVEGTYRGHRIVSMCPPSSGGIALIQLFNMLETFDPSKIQFGSAEHLHLVAEIEKRVFADRTEYLGDPDFYDVPAKILTDKAYARSRAGTIRKDARSDPKAMTHGALPKESEETLHFSVVDKWGNAVSNTTTLNASYGSGVVVRGAGFLLNNEMDDFSAKPGIPNLFGAIGREANAIAPRKRMLSSMSPTLVFRDRKIRYVVGTPGGTTIFTSVFQVLVNRIDFGMDLSKAVAAPRFHHQWPPRRADRDPIFVERMPGNEVAAPLKKLGYVLVPRGRIGDIQAIEIKEGKAIGVADPRGIGKPVYE